MRRPCAPQGAGAQLLPGHQPAALDGPANGEDRKIREHQDEAESPQPWLLAANVALQDANHSRGAVASEPGICAIRSRFVVPASPNGRPAAMTMV
jgi:hypothetical protein